MSNNDVNKDEEKKRPQTVNPSNSKSGRSIPTEPSKTNGKTGQEKILITGDDVLIEYVNRLIIALKKLLSTER